MLIDTMSRKTAVNNQPLAMLAVTVLLVSGQFPAADRPDSAQIRPIESFAASQAHPEHDAGGILRLAGNAPCNPEREVCND